MNSNSCWIYSRQYFLHPQHTYPSPWEGLDASIDTQDEVELAIRMFPRVLGFRGDELIVFCISWHWTDRRFLLSHSWQNSWIIWTWFDDNLLYETIRQTIGQSQTILFSEVIHQLLQENDDDSSLADTCQLVLDQLYKKVCFGTIVITTLLHQPFETTRHAPPREFGGWSIIILKFCAIVKCS